MRSKRVGQFIGGVAVFFLLPVLVNTTVAYQWPVIRTDYWHTMVAIMAVCAFGTTLTRSLAYAARSES